MRFAAVIVLVSAMLVAVTTAVAQVKLQGHASIHGSTTITYPINAQSAYFTTSGQGILFPANSDFSFGTNDFTIEAWAYHTANNSTYRQLMGIWGATNLWQLTWCSGTSMSLVWQSSGSCNPTGFNPSLNTWYHYAWTRQGSTNRFFVNGTLQFSTTDSTNYTNVGSYVGIGVAYNQSFTFAGYVTGVRVLNGQAAYTSNFTPSHATTFAHNSNCVLLTDFSTTSDQSPKARGAYTNQGSVTFSSFVPTNW